MSSFNFPPAPPPPLPPEPECDTSTVDWALFALTIISTSVTWWLFPLPTIFTRGFKAYIRDVSWESLRLLNPSMVAFKAIAQDRSHWQMSYYSGVAKPTTRLQNIKASGKDLFIIASTVLSLYRLCSGGETGNNLTFNSSSWTYPSLPVAILGLIISIFSRTRVRMWVIYISTLGIIAIIAAATSVVIAFTVGDGLFWFSLFLIIYMTIPLWALSQRTVISTVMLSSGARLIGPVVGATSSDAYFPFCALKGWGFAGPILGIGIINCVFALYAAKLQPRVESVVNQSDEEAIGEEVKSEPTPTVNSADEEVSSREMRSD
ncbi:hypothetical protein BDN70DRAFT_899024 [Pholiota conissans]|uniref:Uncharacterized protein n=1 Tax=Pholiota conissans TaxID=109636 RepID=A0A9P6CW95_9AGAR|nr:hypothetical protein BDN70DRAFT_899024 [Pholiota conissans]